MGFKIKKTKKQRILGTLSLLLFLFILICIIYFLTFFFSLASSTHEGEKIIESDWRVVIAEGYGYNAPQGVIFSFEDNGRFSIKYEDGDKIASGFYKIKLDDDLVKNGPSSGTIKLLTLPFIQDFPDEWEMGQLRSDISFKFIYSNKDRDGLTIYIDDDYNIQSDTLELQTNGEIFKIVREGSEEEKQYKTSTADPSDKEED